MYCKDVSLTSAAALFYASEAGHVDCVDLLLEKGADTSILSRDAKELSALMIAARRNHTQVINSLINHGCDVNLKNSNGDTALDIAIKRERLEATKILLRAMGGVTYPVESVALHFALAGSLTQIRTLMNVVTLTYTHMRLESTNPNAWLSMILQEGGHLLRWWVLYGLLHVALEDCDHALLKELLTYKFNPNVLLRSGKTPLGTAITTRNQESALLLIENEADPNMPNKDGLSSLALALNW